MYLLLYLFALAAVAAALGLSIRDLESGVGIVDAIPELRSPILVAPTAYGMAVALRR